MYEHYNKHYIRIRGDGAVIEGWSDGAQNTREATEDDILLTDEGGYQFRLIPGGAENPPLYTADSVPLYRWDGGEVVRRAVEDIRAEQAERSRMAEHTAQLAALTAKLRASDDAVMAVVEGLFSATTATGFIAALIAAAKSIKATLAERTSLREQIAEIKNNKNY